MQVMLNNGSQEQFIKYLLIDLHVMMVIKMDVEIQVGIVEVDILG